MGEIEDENFINWKFHPTAQSWKFQKQMDKVEDRAEICDDYIEIIKADVKSVMFGQWELNEVVFLILKALQSVSSVRFYGVTMLVDVLRGFSSERILKNQLDQLPEFAALKGMPRERIQGIVMWMIREHYILQTKGKYPVLHSTYKGMHYSEMITENQLKKLRDILTENE